MEVRELRRRALLGREGRVHDREDPADAAVIEADLTVSIPYLADGTLVWPGTAGIAGYETFYLVFGGFSELMPYRRWILGGLGCLVVLGLGLAMLLNRKAATATVQAGGEFKRGLQDGITYTRAQIVAAYNAAQVAAQKATGLVGRMVDAIRGG